MGLIDKIDKTLTNVNRGILLISQVVAAVIGGTAIIYFSDTFVQKGCLVGLCIANAVMAYDLCISPFSKSRKTTEEPYPAENIMYKYRRKSQRTKPKIVDAEFTNTSSTALVPLQKDLADRVYTEWSTEEDYPNSEIEDWDWYDK